MVGLDRIERSCLIAFVNPLRAIFQRDDDRLIIRPRMPGPVNGHCALGARYADLPGSSVSTAMELGRKTPIIKLRARFGIDFRGCKRASPSDAGSPSKTALRSADKCRYREYRHLRDHDCKAGVLGERKGKPKARRKAVTVPISPSSRICGQGACADA